VIADGQLSRLQNRFITLDQEMIHGVLLDVAVGMADAHALGIMHRDLEPSNILFDSHDRAKIADWGKAVSVLDGPFTEKCGTCR
jgi:serine/threonine protein kinase